MYVENPVAWGTKRICQDCKAKYYDLRHSPAVCPKCHAEFVEPPKARSATRAAGGAGKGRTRAGFGSNSWARPAGAHSPFAEANPPSEEASAKVSDDGDVDDETRGEAPEVEKDENRASG